MVSWLIVAGLVMTALYFLIAKEANIVSMIVAFGVNGLVIFLRHLLAPPATRHCICAPLTCQRATSPRAHAHLPAAHSAAASSTTC